MLTDLTSVGRPMVQQVPVLTVLCLTEYYVFYPVWYGHSVQSQGTFNTAFL